MTAPPTLTFTPSWKADTILEGARTEVVRYIDQQTGKPTDDRSAALTVVLRFEPTMRDGIAIDRKRADIAGGTRDLAELEAELAALELEARQALIADTWDDPDTVDMSDPATDAVLERAWDAWSSPLRGVVAQSRELLARIDFMARWAVLWESGPKGWADLGARPLHNGLLLRLMAAYGQALEEHAEGNG